jgi:dihydrolipoamide dehydrogenase
MAKEYDVVVVGAGPGGYVAAIRASQLGLKTAIVEKKYWGGVCLNVGCIPSKALLRNAELVHILKDQAKEFGIKFKGEVTFDYAEAFKRSRRVAEGRVKGVRFLMKKNKIDEYDGWGAFKDARTLEVALNDGKSETLNAKNFIIAAGATTRLIPGSKLSELVVTYVEQIMSDTLPASIIIAGASAIGVEFAYILHHYGVDVTIVEFLDRIVPLEDEESPPTCTQYHRSGSRC